VAGDAGVALVSGTSRGIGREIARQLAADHGLAVLAGARDPAGADVLTRVLATEERGHGVLTNSMCPGWVRTDMGGRSAPRSVEKGAETIVWLATLPDDGPTGGFFRDRRPIEW
jgi:NAD(P)-dependent dehydrogenase (short-subunit alcohol dehydrogenase family)